MHIKKQIPIHFIQYVLSLQFEWILLVLSIFYPTHNFLPHTLAEV